MAQPLRRSKFSLLKAGGRPYRFTMPQAVCAHKGTAGASATRASLQPRSSWTLGLQWRHAAAAKWAEAVATDQVIRNKSIVSQRACNSATVATATTTAPVTAVMIVRSGRHSGELPASPSVVPAQLGISAHGPLGEDPEHEAQLQWNDHERGLWRCERSEPTHRRTEPALHAQ